MATVEPRRARTFTAGQTVILNVRKRAASSVDIRIRISIAVCIKETVVSASLFGKAGRPSMK